MAAALLIAASGAAAAVAETASPPTTRITFGPEGLTNIANPTFAYESSDPEAQFECRLDGAPFAPCGPSEEEASAGPPGYGPLSQGRHVFEVRAVNQSGIADPTPARAAFTVDTESPTAEIVGGPAGVTHDRRPKFRLRIAGARGFYCILTGKGVRIRKKGCDGPRTFRPPYPLPEGEYELRVSAFDRAGNVTPNTRSFFVRTKPGPPPSPYAGSTLYSGGGHGIRVTFLLRGRELLQAHVVATLDCLTNRGGEKRLHHGRFDYRFASTYFPLRVSTTSRFRAGISFEESLSEELPPMERFLGKVGRKAIAGRFSYREDFISGRGTAEKHEICQTGAFPKSGPRPLTFRAGRR